VHFEGEDDFFCFFSVFLRFRKIHGGFSLKSGVGFKKGNKNFLPKIISNRTKKKSPQKPEAQHSGKLGDCHA